MRATGHVERRRDRRVPYTVGGGGEGKRPNGRHRRRGEDNIKIDIQSVGWGGMYWINLVKNGDGKRALPIAVINFWDS
jgi:hypothetical protein